MNATASYMREVRQHPLLTADEEAGLLGRYAESRDPAAGRRIIEAHLAFVVGIAKQYSGQRAHLADLVQEGNIGLLSALEKFDPSRGSFRQRAIFCARCAILKYMLDNSMPLALSASRRDRRLFCELSRAQKCGGLSAEKLAELVEAAEESTESLSALVEARRTAMSEIDAASHADLPSETVAANQIRGRLRAIVQLFESTLSARDREIFRARWLTERPSVQRELGRLYGLSRVRIAQIERGILNRLRILLRRELGDALEAC